MVQWANRATVPGALKASTRRFARWQGDCPSACMTTLRMLLLVCAGATGFAQNAPRTEDPAQVIYDAGLKQEAAGRADRAKLLMLTLAATYPDHPLTAKAKLEIGAIYLFLEAQGQAREGKVRAAHISFRTLAALYGESPLARVAEEQARLLGPPPAR
jgi:outer membrane protein assembly factor BamD (BamD/ComL family)